jgi:polyisoprenoid-binding protein YceI
MTNRASLAVCIALGAGAADAEPVNSSVPAPLPMFTLHPSETHARFEAKFLGFITVRGKFGRTTGKLLHDPVRRDAASRADDWIEAQIDATSLDAHVANSETTNQILRGPEFFNVEKFPVIAFKSTRFNWQDDKLTSIDGGLTLLGVSRPVTLLVEKSGCTSASADAPARCTADAFVNVMRSEFGMRGWSVSVSDEVKISISLVAVAASGARADGGAHGAAGTAGR